MVRTGTDSARGKRARGHTLLHTSMIWKTVTLAQPKLVTSFGSVHTL
eukprot:jgi/Mesvir1/28569/Mv26150-RA.1